MNPGKVAVTGAFSYSGSYIAEAFLEAGWQVSTLTRHPQRPHRLQGQIAVLPLDFADSIALEKNLRGVDVLVNTYWVRFDYRGSSFAQAIRNSGQLFAAAHSAGVQRIIHLSVSNPDAQSSLPYYAGKAEVEKLLAASGVPHSILRPTLIFGEQELLVNNIAWLLRHSPILPIPGDGGYRIQPIYVRDLAKLALSESARSDNRMLNAAAQEILSYKELIHFLRDLVSSQARMLNVSARMAIGMAQVASFFLRDVLLTRDELDGLMQERLYVGNDHIHGVSFMDWARNNAETLGAHYTNELRRHHQILIK